MIIHKLASKFIKNLIVTHLLRPNRSAIKLPNQRFDLSFEKSLASWIETFLHEILFFFRRDYPTINYTVSN